MTTIYKLTDANDQTKNETQWGAGVSHEVTGIGELCSPGWLHAYTHPLLAVLLNPIHAGFVNPHLWLAEGSGNTKLDRGMKVGYAKITTIEQIDLPVITRIQRVAFSILCALEVYRKPEFIKWANAWLDGSDRSALSADAAVHAACILHTSTVRAGYAVDAAVAAARTCVVVDVYVDADADRANNYAGYNAAAAASCAAYANAAGYTAGDIDLVALAEKAMTY